MISIPLKPCFKGFCWGIFNILHAGVYYDLTYCPSHRELIHLKGLTVNIIYASSHKVLLYIKSTLLKPLQVSGNIKSIMPLWDIRQLAKPHLHS